MRSRALAYTLRDCEKGHGCNGKLDALFLAGFYRLIAYKLWPEEGVTVIENSTTASEYATPVCESIRRKLSTNETWYPCYTECNVDLCEKVGVEAISITSRMKSCWS